MYGLSIWLRREMSERNHLAAPRAVGSVGCKFTREHERAVKSCFLSTENVIKELFDFASFVCDSDEEDGIPCENVDD
ncbi:hypothetical protein L596_017095 [Steinernema carpocapsae]|uniref:Uncharacterized protein n=1 Tax=Steinernema carpocapsae TaxID=34508 RepID=A0A4U5N0U9_STECR|nr:hypothetical protein L596_017095 [Steinernema carpocapsae]